MRHATNIYEERPDMDTMGGRLSRAREAAGVSLKELARQLGVKLSTVNAWECDRSQPGAHRLTKLAGMLNVSLSWILHGVGTAPAEPAADELAETVSAQLDRLKLLHAETGQLIVRLQNDLARLGTTG